MFYVDIQQLEGAAFKRLTGVTPAVFAMMVEVVQHAHRAFGRPSKLSYEDQVLVMLMYLREYRVCKKFCVNARTSLVIVRERGCAVG